MTGACLDDNDAAEFASGALSGTAATRVEKHLAGCRDCRALVAALAPVGGEADSEVQTLPRPAKLPRGKKRGSGALDPTIPRRPHEPEVSVGDTIGRYVVLARLGAGGMGVVWSAYDPQLDRKVALKLLRAGGGVESSEGRARLVREAQAIAQLSHPNVVAVYDVGTAESGEVYIAMEFVEGETLTTWLARWERPWREVLDVFLQAGRGLAAAHAVGLLHRDFKPDNVLVGTDGRVRVTDFGLARSLITTTTDEEKQTPAPKLAALRVTLTATGTVLGTPRYMAPEQVRGKDTDARSDQFSFCVAMYESLYGVHPLPGDTASEMVEKGGRAAPAPDGAVPASIGKALARGLEVEPTRRWPTMHTLLHELTPPPVRTRERWLVAGLGGLVVAGVAAAAVMATGASSPKYPDDRQELIDEIKKLESERDTLIAQIDKDKDDAHKIEVLKEGIVERDQKIQVLVDRVAQLTTDAGVPIVRRSAPPPPSDPGGLTAAQARAALARIDFHGCVAEWRDRVGPEPTPALSATLYVTPDGAPNAVAVHGTEDTPLRVCMEGRIEQVMFPAIQRNTRVSIGLDIGADPVQVSPTVEPMHDGTGVIDPADTQRP